MDAYAFRLSQRHVAVLDRLAERRGCSRTGALRALLDGAETGDALEHYGIAEETLTEVAVVHLTQRAMTALTRVSERNSATISEALTREGHAWLRQYWD